MLIQSTSMPKAMKKGRMLVSTVSYEDLYVPVKIIPVPLGISPKSVETNQFSGPLVRPSRIFSIDFVDFFS